MSIYKKRLKEEIEDETASYDDMEKTIWDEEKNKSRGKSGPISRK